MDFRHLDTKARDTGGLQPNTLLKSTSDQANTASDGKAGKERDSVINCPRKSVVLKCGIIGGGFYH